MPEEKTMMSAGIAKTAFRELLDRVERGETIVIERHGKATAVVSPIPENVKLSDFPRERKAR